MSDETVNYETRIAELERRLYRMEIERKEDDALLTIREVSALTTLSPREIQRRVSDKRFPGPVALGEKRRAWPKSRVKRWIKEQERAS